MEAPRGQRTVFGVAAALLALGVAQLAAVPFGPEADARTAVGSTVIDHTPGPVKEWAIQTFGTADKVFLSVVIVVVILVLAAVTGGAETRRRPVGSIAIAVAGVAGAAAVLSRPGAGVADAIPALIGAVCGIAALRLLLRQRTPDTERRRVLAALGVLGLGIVGGVAGVAWSRRLHSVDADRDAFTAPTPGVRAPPIPEDVQPRGVTLPSFVTSSADFYRIDTALAVPQLPRDQWRLRIHGLVDREITFAFEDLADFELIEKVVTLTCVSNPIGGDLISNAVWTGYRVRDLLARAGVRPEADMVLSTSIDGFTAGSPVDALTDRRDALLAITMNGQPLPPEHGYPARLVVPGLYGYVSATKWVVDLELTRFDRAQAYWTKLGWSPRGPIKTSSRIDVPRSGQVVPVGPVTFGGVAWAQNRGVRAVEVRIDTPSATGIWQPAELGASYSGDTWRLWSLPWRAESPGVHTITVRARDNTGQLQTEEYALPVPDGATGWHAVSFSVR
ncbi:molybdopterin-dependent oxidoreductase [Mycobacterium sp. ACS4331]|uniref:molybdopterin-dependent oxidoreductase n=1 Tax=Mycobacterium sp. ACS4331 TaxID=1834121 RepID=UPI00080205B2|nr:molybdopterin-dependent oxidoreductase [Mycobacterium sp. ACS4331]OBF21168.1 oxidoreductase [Mycobacterium sp. ACS4331]